MNFLRNLSFNYKFTIIGLTLVVTATGVISSIFIAMSNLAVSSERGWQRIAASAYLSEAGELRDSIAILVTTTLAKKAEANTGPQKIDAQKKLQEMATQLGTSLKNAEDVLTGTDQERFTPARTNFELLLATYIQTGDELLTMVQQGQQEAALAEQPRFTNSFIQLGSALLQLNKVLSSEATTLREYTQEKVVTTKKIIIGGAVGGIAFLLLIQYLILRSITVPMAQLTQAARRIAAGDINQHVDYASNDEIGTLSSAFRDLIHYLQEMAYIADTMSNGDLTLTVTSRSSQDVVSLSFRRMIDTLRDASAKVKDSAQVVATSISQILTSTSQLAASVSETATSVSQTATTVEEVKQTAYVTSQKANDISIEAKQTAAVSQDGETAISRSVAGLNHIREQMESISQSVVRLGEHSQEIGEIISAVGEIAEQSNLLAVNAAIEAAKAGEQGKGFAIVAQEVKTLAGQSKQATAQVRTILGEIQKATNVAVLVTEQGVKAVEIGVQQSLEAGESIRTLAQNITGAANAVTQIASSSQQQLIGMDQVGTAMKSIKQASAQNADGMRQIQSAVQNLHHVGQTLTELVAQFKLTDDASELQPTASE